MEPTPSKIVGLKPIELNIRKFKKYLVENFPNLTQTERRNLAKQYKEGAWQDFHTMVKKPFNFPTHSKGEQSGE